ncbi:MAG: hypothetical protein QM330_03905 [Acidobacteriota bacterium]|jgi:hypothetical protein|nr:hypothetical protein [Acidobacteriota bacterium]NLT33895.1 hypothetical protein [Acidobacteriota bacterium]
MELTATIAPAFAPLGDFIAAHPEIVLGRSEVSIPQEVRGEFYRHFDAARRAVVAAHLATLPVDAADLARRMGEMEREVKEMLGLERIDAPMDLASFLADPPTGLERILYNRMFDLLQGKLTGEEFEARAGEDIRSAAGELYRLGYERWAALSIIRMLDPEEGFAVELDEDSKPFLGRLVEIAFGRQAHHPTMRLPEFVLRLRGSGRHVAVKMPLAREVDGYAVRFRPAVRPRKRTGDTSYTLDSRVMFLSLMETAGSIPVYADIYECTLTRPDVMIEFAAAGELADPFALDLLRKHLWDLKPKDGGNVVVIGPLPSPPPELPGARLVAPGFDAAAFGGLIEPLRT